MDEQALAGTKRKFARLQALRRCGLIDAREYARWRDRVIASALADDTAVASPPVSTELEEVVVASETSSGEMAARDKRARKKARLTEYKYESSSGYGGGSDDDDASFSTPSSGALKTYSTTSYLSELSNESGEGSRLPVCSAAPPLTLFSLSAVSTTTTAV